MIDKAQLIEISKLMGVRPWQQEKHYIQHLILNILSEEPLVFKGGTYLWLFHGLNRFSEDLDFTASDRLREGLGRKVSNSLELFGVGSQLKVISDNQVSYAFRINAKGPLNTTDKDLCRVYVEISRRELVLKKPMPQRLDYPAYSLPVKNMAGMDLEEAAAEKVRAILTRKKARDIFDLHYLVTKKGISFNESLANKKLEYYKMTVDKELFRAKVDEKEAFYQSELRNEVFGDLPAYAGVKKRLSEWISSGVP